jgi:hypothetical protein
MPGAVTRAVVPGGAVGVVVCTAVVAGVVWIAEVVGFAWVGAAAPPGPPQAVTIKTRADANIKATVLVFILLTPPNTWII